MAEKETNLQRIARLEGTVDALKYHLEHLAKQLLLLEIQFSDENEDIHYLSKETANTLHTIQRIHPCRRKSNK